MYLATLLLSAMLSPQVPPAAEEELPPVAPAAPAIETTEVAAAPAGVIDTHIEAGLRAFRRRRFSLAREEFERAAEVDPQSAAAAFYLGYTYYKIAEPTRRLTAEKQQAKELFAKAYQLDPTFQPVWGQNP